MMKIIISRLLFLISALPAATNLSLCHAAHPDHVHVVHNFGGFDGYDSLSTIISLDSDINNFFDGESLYSFEPLPSDADHSDINAAVARKWVVRRVGSRRRLDEINEIDHNKETVHLIINAVISLLCVATAAMAAGLTMGLLSLDPLTLEIKRRASISAEERQYSEDLLPLLVGHSKRHKLLVTLLLFNAAANEALPLFLDELFPGKLASILVSVTLVLFFGEIVPSAFFTGPDQVRVAAKLVPMVKFMMLIMTPLATPIANILDRVLVEDGGHKHKHDGKNNNTASDQLDIEEQDVTGGNYYNRGELSALVRIQYEAQMAAKRKEKMMNHSLLVQAAATTPVAAASATTPSPKQADLSVPTSSNVSVSSVNSHNEIRKIGRDLTTSARQSSTRKVSANSANPKSSLKFMRSPSIHRDEITMIEGALTMTTKVAADICTPLRRVYALPSDTVMDEDCMVKIWSRGFSRIPVYSPVTDADTDKHNSNMDIGESTKSLYDEIEDTSRIIGVLLTRQLIVVNPEENRPITTLPLPPPPCIAPSVHLVDLINLFQAGGGRGKPGLHLAIVCARPNLASGALENGLPIPKEAGVVGIVTLEDVVEELLQEEIYDESDRDLELAQWGVDRWKNFVLGKKQKRDVGLAVKNDGETGAHFDSSLVKKVVINNEVTPLLG